MNYYQHHIGDYSRDTAHLTVIEDCMYRRMLDLYYASERPLPLDRKGLYRLLRAKATVERSAVDQVLQEFFDEGESGWHQRRCDGEIAKAQDRINAARDNGKRGGRPSKPTDNPAGSKKKTQRVSENNPDETQTKALHTPIPNTHTPIPLPSGNGAARSDPAKEEIWRSGKTLLAGQGISTEDAGAFLGKLCKDYGQKLVLEAVRDAVRETPAEAKSWLIARCQERRAPNRQTALEDRNAAAARAALEEPNGPH